MLFPKIITIVIASYNSYYHRMIKVLDMFRCKLNNYYVTKKCDFTLSTSHAIQSRQRRGALLLYENNTIGVMKMM